MRVNVYTEELPNGNALPSVEIVTADYVSSRDNLPMTNYGLRVYLRSHPDLHYIPGRDDDRSAVTFWCGPSLKNVVGLVDMLKGAVEVDNLNRFRGTVEKACAEAEAAETDRATDKPAGGA